MNDTIYREDAIKAVKSSIADGWGRISPVDACQNIRCLPSADRPKQGEWIPYSERLPENGCYYLWCSDNGSVQSDYYRDGFDKERKYGYKIVAWMPLPTAYKEGADDE